MKLTVQEVKDRVFAGATFADVAREAGVTGERIRQVWVKEIAPTMPEGLKTGFQIKRTRRPLVVKQKLETKAAEVPHLHKLRLIVEKAGLVFEPIQASRPAGHVVVKRQVVKIGNYTCRVYLVANTFRPAPGYENEYWRTTVTPITLKGLDFSLFLVDCLEKPELVFVVPSNLLLATLGDQKIATVYIPTKHKPNYHRKSSRFEWWDYANKWEQLKP